MTTPIPIADCSKSLTIHSVYLKGFLFAVTIAMQIVVTPFTLAKLSKKEFCGGIKTMMGFDNTIVKIETLLFQVEQVGSLSPEEQRVVRAAQEIRNGNSESERHFMKLYQLAKAQRVESLKLPRLEDKSPGERRTILMDQLFHQTFRGVNPINVYRNSRSYFVKANVDLVFHSLLLEAGLDRSLNPLEKSRLLKKARGVFKFLVSHSLAPWQLKHNRTTLNRRSRFFLRNFGQSGLYFYVYSTHGLYQNMRYFSRHLQNIKNLALLSLVIVLWNPILESYEYWDTANDIDEKEKLSPKEEGALELVNQETNQETLVVLKGIVHKMENTPTPEKISSQQEDYREGLLLTLKEIKSNIEKNPDSKESTK